MRKISIVSPVHNESDGIARFVDEVLAVFSPFEFELEILLVDDGSVDTSWEKIVSISKTTSQVLGLKLSRNFGKEAAILAGLSKTTGDVTFVMDSDLQHPPSIMIEMLNLHKKGHELVIGRKLTRPDQSIFLRIGARTWGSIFESLTGLKIKNTTDFRLLGPNIRREILYHVNARPFFRGDSSSLGFSMTFLDFEPISRAEGKSSFNATSLFRLAFRSITTFTSKPLHFVTMSSIALMAAALILGIQTLIKWFAHESSSGFTTVILLLLGIGSLQLFGIGILGEYVAAISENSQNRPVFIIEAETETSR